MRAGDVDTRCMRRVAIASCGAAVLLAVCAAPAHSLSMRSTDARAALTRILFTKDRTGTGVRNVVDLKRELDRLGGPDPAVTTGLTMMVASGTMHDVVPLSVRRWRS